MDSANLVTLKIGARQGEWLRMQQRMQGSQPQWGTWQQRLHVSRAWVYPRANTSQVDFRRVDQKCQGLTDCLGSRQGDGHSLAVTLRDGGGHSIGGRARNAGGDCRQGRAGVRRTGQNHIGVKQSQHTRKCYNAMQASTKDMKQWAWTVLLRSRRD